MSDRKRVLREALEKVLADAAKTPRRCPQRFTVDVVQRGKAATQRRSTRLH